MVQLLSLLLIHSKKRFIASDEDAKNTQKENLFYRIVFGRQFKQNRDICTATVVQIFSDSNHLSQEKKRYQGCDVEKSRCKTTQI